MENKNSTTAEENWKQKIINGNANFRGNIDRCRTPYDLVKFNEIYGWKSDSGKWNLRKNFFRVIKEKAWLNPTCMFSCVSSLIPIVQWLPKYSVKQNLLIDILGGLTVGIVCVPQGLADARVAGMPPVTGLYMSIFPALIYAFFGTCRHASPGTVTLLALMTRIVRYRLLPCEDCWMSHNVSDNQLPQNYSTDTNLDYVTPIDIGTTLAFFVGLTLILMGIVRLDFLTTYLSDQVVTGFTVGAGVHIFTSQLYAAFGLQSPRNSGAGKLLWDYISLFQNIANTNYATLIISLASLSFLLFVKFFVNPLARKKFRSIPPLPGELFVVIVGVLVSYFVHVKQRYDVKIVENVPANFPKASIPRFDLTQYVILDAFVIAVITYCVSIFQAKQCAKTWRYKVDNRQEFFAHGLGNVVGSFFQNFNSGLSISRTILCEQTGAKTQINALVGVGVAILTILCIAPYLALLPQCILATIILAACIDMFRLLRQLKYIWKVSKIDFLIYVITVISIVIFDLTYGLAISVLFNVFSTVIRAQWTPVMVVGTTNDVDIYAEIDRYTLFNEIPGIKIVRFDAPLCFANVDTFKKKLYKSCSLGDSSKNSFITTDNDKIVKPPTHVIVDCSGIIYIDLMGIDVLKEIFTTLTGMSYNVLFAHFNGFVQVTLEKSDLFQTIPKSKLFASVKEAVVSAKLSEIDCIISSV